MAEQLNTAITFRAFYVNSGTGATGLTVTVDVYNPAGTKIVTGAATTEVGDGLYEYTLASGSTTTEGAYTAVFKTAGTVDQKHIAAQWEVGTGGVEYLDKSILAVFNSIAQRIIYNISRFDDSNLTLVIGDDYQNETAIDVTIQNPDAVDLSDGTMAFYIDSTAKGSVTVTNTSPTAVATISLDTTDTTGWSERTYNGGLVFTKTGGDIITFAIMNVKFVKKVTA